MVFKISCVVLLLAVACYGMPQYGGGFGSGSAFSNRPSFGATGFGNNPSLGGSSFGNRPGSSFNNRGSGFNPGFDDDFGKDFFSKPSNDFGKPKHRNSDIEVSVNGVNVKDLLN